MPVVSKPAVALLRKRLACALIVASLGTLIAACSNDDDKPATSTTAAAANSGTSDSDTSNPQGPAQDNSLAVTSAPADATIQSPAAPPAGADPALSAAASAPLAPPVIHTVD
jgi:hypothetical protein